MKMVWANNKLIQSWDRALIAAGGAVLGVFMAISLTVGERDNQGINAEALHKARVQMQCVPEAERSPLVEQSELC